MKPILHLASSVLIAFLVCLPFGPVGRQQILRNASFNEGVQVEIREMNPDWVLVGNSLLEEGIDPNMLAGMLGGTVRELALTGGGSAWMYLALKNLVIPSVEPGTRVVFFFRNNRLTDPGYRVTGKHKARLDRYALTEEPLLDRLAYLRSADWLQRVLWYVFPLTRFDTRSLRDRGLKTLVARLTGAHGDAKRVNRALATVFADERMELDLLDQYQLEAEDTVGAQQDYEFSESVEASFLPDIVRLSNKAHLKPIFVICPQRSDVEGAEPNPEAVAYMNALQEYLGRLRVPLVDVRKDAVFDASHFAAGDHLNRATGRPLFTRLVGERLRVLAGETAKPRKGP